MVASIFPKFPHTSKSLKKSVLLLCAAVWSGFSMTYLLSDARLFAPLALLFAPILYGFYRMCLDSTDRLRASAKLLCLLLACLSAGALYLSANVQSRFDALFAGVAPFAVRGFCIAGLALLLFALFSFFCARCTEGDCAVFSSPLSVKGLFLLWAILFFAWTVLYFLCYYPGIFSPDTFSQLYIVEGIAPWRNHHPILHTLLLFLTVRLTGHRPIFFILLQILLTTALYAYTCFWLRKRRIWKWLWYAVVLYFLAHPIHSTNAFSFVKDTLFSASVLFFTLCTADLILLKESSSVPLRRLIRFAVSALLVLFLRNNGFLVMLLSLPILLLVARKTRLRISAAGIAPLIVFGCVQFILFPKIGVAQTSIVESLGVPLQQMCSVIASGKSFSADVTQYLNSLLPAADIVAAFNPSTIDPIKFHEHFNAAVINDDLGAFLHYWAQGLAQHPLEYVKAYLSLTEFLWNPMQKAGMVESFTTSVYFTFTAPHPLIPALSTLWISLVNLSQFSQYAFVTRPFWNSALFYMTACLCAVAVIQRRRAKLLAIWIPALSVWVSLMIATPTGTCGRYAYSVFLCLPIFIALAAEKPETTDSDVGSDDLTQIQAE